MAIGNSPFPGFTNGMDVVDLNLFDLAHALSAPAFEALGGGDYVTLSGTQAAWDTPFNAGDGDDRIDGTANSDTILGGRGDDWLIGDIPGEDDDPGDLLIGGAGDDFLDGLYGNETLDGGAGNDRLEGGIVEDVLRGGTGADTLTASLGEDRLDGGAGNDSIVGGGGPWTGGIASPDLLEGGSGADTFAFFSSSAFAAIFYDSGKGGGNRDRIVDFSRGEGDRIDLHVDADQRTVLVDDAFTFVGKLAPGETPGIAEVGYYTKGESTIVHAETGAEFGPETGFEITLVNFDGKLFASDFVL